MTGTIPVMHMIRSALAGLLALFVASAALAQTFPTVPAQSVIGRLGTPGVSGPSSAIPMATFLTALGGSQTANRVWAGPTSGGAAAPTFRALVGGDIPAINLAAGNVNGGVTGVTPIANGGSNGATKQAGFDNLAPTATRAGDIVYWDGSHWVTLAGNNSGTKILTENGSGVPSWAATGSVSSVTCGTGLSGGVITTTGTCAIDYSLGFLSTSPSIGVGYATGAGGTVTQATSKSTGVTLNKISGQITMNNAALGGSTAVSFTLTNSAIAATDVVVHSIASGLATSATYTLIVDAIGAGSCRFVLRNQTGGSLSEAVVINFAVIKAANN